MKHYLTRAQMRELAEIDFNTRQLATHECTENGITYFSLSIGDLIEMIPKTINVNGKILSLIVWSSFLGNWGVTYDYNPIYKSFGKLIDALFDMLILLKKEGKI
jgi:hypothetical protein|nr:MAG TPA: hypothetical protein [Caudoviricetes sp.]